jgi:hypothetical protein
MKCLIYLSTAVNLLTDTELIGLLNTAREKNKKYNITGVLLYSEGTFIQVLEGMPGDVDAVFKSIKDDRRHKNIIQLINEPLAKRNFPDWSMGFSSLNADLNEEVSGYITSTDHITNSEADHSAISILKTFINTNKLIVNSH